jgi:hypothetical protein
MEAIFLVRQLMGRYREEKKHLHMVMWWALEKHKVPTKYITLIKDM